MTNGTHRDAPFDSRPYRHRLSEMIERAPILADGRISVAEACVLMERHGTAAILVADDDGRAAGILTENDVVRLLARLGDAALERPLELVMSHPVHALPADAPLYQAMGRMSRLGLRHLLAVDDSGHPLGVIGAGEVLRFTAGRDLVIGDSLAEANGPEDLAAVRQALVTLAGALRRDGIAARETARLIAGVVREMTARAAVLVEAAMVADGWGRAPARWALLVLGSAGRGESLLAFDQDNAIVHAGGGTDDPWFAEAGRRINALLDAAGVPYCPGEVMARNPVWRHSLERWEAEVRRWVFEPALQTAMSVDIFFDFVAVHGDRALAARLRDTAVATAAQSAFFLRFLLLNAAMMDVALGVFGQFATRAGRFNAKKTGLLPIVGVARARALAAGIGLTGTVERYRALAAAGVMSEGDVASLEEAHETILAAMLDQQLADIAAGRAPTALVEPARMDKAKRRRLKAALERVRALVAVAGGL